MSSFRLAALAAFVACAAGWGALAHAQVYRIVGPDGRVTFSDRPPADGRAAPAAAVAIPGGGGGSSTATLPTEVRAAATRFPVTLYTGADCGPCLSARNMLLSRGVPFTERTITTREDIAALQRLSGATSLPFATIGGQHIRGFSDVEWSQYLDAAGYPKTSQLPASFRNPDPQPLVAATQPVPRSARPAPPPQPQRAEAEPSSDGSAPSNPAGIRF
jgi:glutaredoxin